MEKRQQFAQETGPKRLRVGEGIELGLANVLSQDATLSCKQSPKMCRNNSDTTICDNPTNYGPLLPPMLPSDQGKHTLVLDMDGTLLAENTETLPTCDVDFALRQKTTGERTFVSKRPGLEPFLCSTHDLFEVVVFTDSPRKRADVILEALVESKWIRHRLYRDSCTQLYGKLVKDLSRLGRDLSKVIIVDDCPFSYILHQSNAIPIPFFGGHRRDRQLQRLCNFLKNMNKDVDVRIALPKSEFHNNNRHVVNPNAVRSKDEPLLITPANTLTAPNVMGPLLPPMNSCDQGKHTLVLDMDGTLLVELDHEIPNCTPDFTPPVPRTYKFVTYVYKRPGLEAFLAAMEKLFEIVIFTASSEWRAKTLLGHLENKSCIRFHLFRDSCIMLQGRGIVKDLSRLGRDLAKVVIVDDQPRSYELQQFNGIPIEPFDGDSSDRQLTRLIPFLQELSQHQDVRPLIQTKFDYEVFAEIDRH